jgi:hypothetical protein
MPEISVAIMTLNEERNIERCLSSLKGIADEIVVADSFQPTGLRQSAGNMARSSSSILLRVMWSKGDIPSGLPPMITSWSLMRMKR